MHIYMKLLSTNSTHMKVPLGSDMMAASNFSGFHGQILRVTMLDVCIYSYMSLQFMGPCDSCNCLSYFLCCCLCSILFCCGVLWFVSCLACICNLFLLYFGVIFYVVCSWVGRMCLASWGIVYQCLMLCVYCMADWTMWCFFFFCFSVCCFGCYCLWVLVCTLICSYIHFFWGRLGKVGLPFGIFSHWMICSIVFCWCFLGCFW